MRRHALTWWVVLAGGLVGCQEVVTDRGPRQPANGPGGSDYTHAKVVSQRFGEGGTEYWIFQPDDPQPAIAPVVVFLHGWGGTDPRVYGAWIQHIVRKGQVVIYPRYQATLTTSADLVMGDALHAINLGLARIESQGPVRQSGDRIAWVGHSLGGIIAANLSSDYAVNGLPAPAVLMAVEPGGEDHVPLLDLSGLPAETLALLVAGDADERVGDVAARAIRAELDYMPHENVELVIVRSDGHLGFFLDADHYSPLAVAPGFPPDSSLPSDVGTDAAPAGWFALFREERAAERYTPDALDYFGYWKLLDGLLDASFRGENRDYALGGTPQQLFMGTYSDGTPVTTLEVELGVETTVDPG